jgi:hypothetical protein
VNPYAHHLGTRDPREVIAATPQQLAGLARRLGPDGLKRKPAPGKWSAAEVFCHLADCEVAFAFRLRQVLAQENHVIQPFDQDDWSKSYTRMEPQVALQVFTVLRGWNLALLATASPEDFARKVTHPERGEMTFQTLIETMGGHDLNHVKQVEAMLQAQAAPAGA